MTDKTTEALKLAEEALNAMLTHMGMDEDEWTKPTFDQSRKALAAIREALDHSGDANEMVMDWSKVKPGAIKSDPMYQMGYAAAKAEPVKQEMVAVISESAIGLVKLHSNGACLPFGTPLYAAPVSAKREWVELTCQEITALIMEGAAGGGWQGFAERVQAAFKEKNK